MASNPVLDALVNHLVLPYVLPGKEDESNLNVESHLLDRLVRSIRQVQNAICNTSNRYHNRYNALHRSLVASRDILAHRTIDKQVLLRELATLKSPNILILHVVEQNSGLLIWRRKGPQDEESVVFEAFEASPRSESVFATDDVLEWDFPGSSVAIPLPMFLERTFQDSMATFLERASGEKIPRFAARTYKASASTVEVRDTNQPTLITHLLMTLLEANGKLIQTPLVRKHVRDDVCWSDGAVKPWRRSPLWLVFRVGLRRFCHLLFGDEEGTIHYKFLVASLLMQLLDESYGQISHEKAVLIKSKLCRRIAKLEMDKIRESSRSNGAYSILFEALGPNIQRVVDRVNTQIQSAWEHFKRFTTRKIPPQGFNQSSLTSRPLPRRAREEELILKLKNSRHHLEHILQISSIQLTRGNSTQSTFPILNTTPCYQQFVIRYTALSDLEFELEQKTHTRSLCTESTNCIQMANHIKSYVEQLGEGYKDNPEQLSVALLLILELWMVMDKSALKVFPLLMSYNPAITSSILDLIQLPHLKDMRRLQRIQTYLDERHLACTYKMTIFSPLVDGCFAERFFDTSQHLQQMHETIKSDAEAKCKAKREELVQLTAKYDALAKEIAQGTHLWTVTDSLPSETAHDERRCPTCYKERVLKRMKINIHEHPLSSKLVEAKATIFELGAPKAFTAYREATWTIVGIIGQAAHPTAIQPRVLLRDYSELAPYRSTVTSSITLGSAKKSFLTSHYATVQLPADIEDVCRPCGLTFSYFDLTTQSFVSQMSLNPSFAHHFSVQIPPTSPLAVILSNPSFQVDRYGPSSNEVIASQTCCPMGVNVHEFMAYQSLFAGYTRRWLSILTELGSSNLNLSTEPTANLICRLALEVGPVDEHNMGDILRRAHKIFRDITFCERLADLIKDRISVLSSNWRENHCMDILITLLLRLYSLGPESVSRDAFRMIETVRAITYQWTTLLKKEFLNSTNITVARNYSRYALWASLLCRRTFAVFLETAKGGQDTHVPLDPLHEYPNGAIPHTSGRIGMNILYDYTDEPGDHNAYNNDPTPVIDQGALAVFIGASIALQDNMVSNVWDLPQTLRNMVVRDVKTVQSIRALICQSLRRFPNSLAQSLKQLWPEQMNEKTTIFSNISFLAPPNQLWAEMIVNSQYLGPRTVRLHVLEGHLTINGQPLGRLSDEYRKAPIIRELFGDDVNLNVFPSTLPGMTYLLAIDIPGHQIHVGFRNQKVFVRAVTSNGVLEVIERETFFSSIGPHDLPLSLLESCVHFLNLTTGVLEIRQKPRIWSSSEGNWRLNLMTRTAHRRGSTLVDPHGRLFRRFTDIFVGFEKAGHITVYQPEKFPLSVELRRMQLNFFVNRAKLLESFQLRFEIDPDQDAGCFYGLQSTLVVRDVVNPIQRSILVPMGLAVYKRNSMHVSVQIEPTGKYLKYTIDPVLGRITCAMEPRILYQKAMMHALTSFVCPDPLTGRTGTEEAFHILMSAHSQPHTPLNPKDQEYLMLLAALSPRREYYPTDLRCMQKVSWNQNLTATIQHEGYTDIIESIRSTSDQLSIFSPQAQPLPTSQSPRIKHLQTRSSLRRSYFERANAYRESFCTPPSSPYNSRHIIHREQKCVNVFQVVDLIRTWPCQIEAVADIFGILQSWATIGGFERPFDGFFSLNRCLEVDPATEFGPVSAFCRKTVEKDKYSLMFSFSLFAFNDSVNMDVLRVWLAYSLFDELKTLEPPNWASYSQFHREQHPHLGYIVDLLKNAAIPYPTDERIIFGSMLSAKARQKLKIAEDAYEQKIQDDCKLVANFLLQQWPCMEMNLDGFCSPVSLHLDKAMTILRPDICRLFYNLEFSRYIDKVQLIINSRSGRETCQLPELLRSQKFLYLRSRGGEVPCLKTDLMSKSCPHINSTLCIELVENIHRNSLPQRSRKTSQPREVQELRQLVDTVAASRSPIRQQYAAYLKQSLIAFCKVQIESARVIPDVSMRTLDISKAHETVRNFHLHLCRAFEGADPRAQWLQRGGLWPCTSPVNLLEQLRSTACTIFGTDMKESLVAYGVKITALQRILRIEELRNHVSKRKLIDEQRNGGHVNWKPLERPDWLLLELDANLLIREDQVIVALATIAPSSGSNAVLQMNMGQGKTSMIIPMVAAALADSHNLMRIIVPRPLLPQTASILLHRLGGLVGREVKHIPYSRKTDASPGTTKIFYQIHKRTAKLSGVILAAPEHLLSFKLCGIQHVSDAHLEQGRPMIKVQEWIDHQARDVIDESDFILSPRTALCFPSGNQTIVDGHPHRWKTIESLLSVLESHFWNLQREFPRSMEIVRREGGGFPFTFFLQQNAEDALLQKVVADVCNGRTSILPTRTCSDTERFMIKQFISQERVSQDIVDGIRGLYPEKPELRKIIYLLRGLFVHRILLLCLKKRWNVQYGIDPKRDPIAVPYNAKGIPSEQSEWGHPDVSILFSILAHYYAGMNIEEVRHSIELVSRSDDPSRIYESWITTCPQIPGSLRDWFSINHEDDSQIVEIWKYLRFNTTTIDFFLNNSVFPKHAKQFRIKIQASGWDLPSVRGWPQEVKPASNDNQLSPLNTKIRRPLTTGFSGTNDNRDMLPLTIKQDDLPPLLHTSAEVLTYLLQPRNRRYEVAADRFGVRLSEFDFLRLLKQRGIRVLIDSGAQILEMSNSDIAKHWLEVDNEAPAVVYFNTDNKPVVRYRHSNMSEIPLVATPFVENMSDVLVYIDESHTRGTDLPLPEFAHGALTLGLSLQKDTLIQSAMRLRQLGTTQSVTFFAPPEVDHTILDVRKSPSKKAIDSADVIHWLLCNSSDALETISPLFHSMGMDFCRRIQASLDNPDFLDYAPHRDAYLEVVRQKETRSLKQLYEPKLPSKMGVPSLPATFSGPLVGFVKDLTARRKAYCDTGKAVHASALQEVEQEREVAVEVEVESIREVQRPGNFHPLPYGGLHRDIITFVETGNVAVGVTGYEHAFLALRRTAVGVKFGVNTEAITSSLFCSIEFSRTVICPTGKPNDTFLRPVNWVLWSTISETALIVCPEEAEELIPLCREAKLQGVHVATYAAPITRKMLHFNGLSFCAVPSFPGNFKAPKWLTVQLGFLAGRLYFELDEYEEILDFFHLASSEGDPEDGAHIVTEDKSLEEIGQNQGQDLAVTGNSMVAENITRFTKKPLLFLEAWVSARRKNQDWVQTPVGYITHGKHLAESHSFFSEANEEEVPKKFVRPSSPSEDMRQMDNADEGTLDYDFMFEGTLSKAHELVEGEDEDASFYASEDEEEAV
ncbi:hypothetical protein M501DRAFT_1017279 [Patellaria atrata CBS 101060]|uniref:ubiquitinyl hydrolase 1 n=1 Tax=Patellaria atrata CBS 101060 TaxID=1346257 RepID=A0A9P4VQF3_9PEZI|nr:hypothetical protein M501DRAFT_1017279 [Patellaria atrata CBS 101060]